MAFYSDYVLANRPFAYWPLNDDPIGGTNVSQLLLDVSGDNNHMTAYRDDPPTLGYGRQMGFSDCIPVRGMTTSQKSSPSLNEAGLRQSIYYPGNSHFYLDRNFDGYRNFATIQMEFLMGVPPAAMMSSGCVWHYYPITHIAGLTMWCMTVWYKPPFENAGCQMGSSRLFYTWEVAYTSEGGNYLKQSTVFYTAPWLISFEGESATLGYNNNTSPLFESKGTGMLRTPRRMFFHIRPVSSTSFEWEVVVNSLSSPLTNSGLATFAPIVRYGRTYHATNIFENIREIIPVQGDCPISNVSVYYNRQLPPADYFSKSWEDLTQVSPDLEFLSSPTWKLNNQINTVSVLSALPNSLTHQLDTVLARGCSHRFVRALSVTADGSNQYTIRLFLYTYENYPAILVHDFLVGDLIQLEGAQEGLNSIWQITAMDEVSISFIATSGVPFNDENYTLMTIKRPPVGFGIWKKSVGPIYSSPAISWKFKIDDSLSNTSTITAIEGNQSQSAYIRKILKRSTGYQADPEPLRLEWEILGDHKKFILFIGYKQTPKTHSHIIFFGDGGVRDHLIAYNSRLIGNPGLNYAFMYSNRLQPDLKLEFYSQDTATADTAVTTNEYFTMAGVSDFGSHEYPVNNFDLEEQN